MTKQEKLLSAARDILDSYDSNEIGPHWAADPDFVMGLFDDLREAVVDMTNAD